jgi:hypothetical protein
MLLWYVLFPFYFLFSILYEGLILFLDYCIIHNCMDMHRNPFLVEFYL